MIKKQKEKQTPLKRSPYTYYMTNWGFVEQPIAPKESIKTETLATR